MLYPLETPPDFNRVLRLGAVEAAPALLGARVVRALEDRIRLVGRVVETEAYTQDDPSSHSYRGPSPRNRSMFAAAGIAYVYKIYGVHHCLNIVTGAAGEGEAVLIRALEPEEGRETMTRLRGRTANLCDGPGKLCQALDIDRRLDGENMLASARLFLLPPPAGQALREGESIAATPRVGIVKAADWLRRFYLRGNPHVSRGPAADKLRQ